MYVAGQQIPLYPQNPTV